MGINQRVQVRMTDDEVASLLGQCRTATIATTGPSGFPHLVAMWYGLLGGKVYFETKAKSQKVVNLRRDPKISCSVEAGESYDQLRGVAIEGLAVIIDDTSSDEYWAAAVNVFERYQGPYTEQMRPFVEQIMNKRVVVRVDPLRVRSWDHRKLGLPEMPVAGSTAAPLSRTGPWRLPMATPRATAGATCDWRHLPVNYDRLRCGPGRTSRTRGWRPPHPRCPDTSDAQATAGPPVPGLRKILRARGRRILRSNDAPRSWCRRGVRAVACVTEDVRITARSQCQASRRPRGRALSRR